MKNSDASKLPTRFEIATRREGDHWVAWCLPLDLLSQGDTREEAVAALKEAIEGWIESCVSRGTLEGALSELRLHAAKPGPEFDRSQIEMPVPTPLAAFLLAETSASR